MNLKQDKVCIAYLDHVRELGGAEHLLLTLITHLPKTVSAVVVCGKEGQFANEARKRDIPTYITPLPRFFSNSWIIAHRKVLNPIAVIWNLIAILGATLQSIKLLKIKKVDLVQTNSSLAHVYGGLAARFVGIPCIWYFHDLVERKRLLGSIALSWQLLANFLATRVIGVSKAVAQSLSLGAKCCVIYAGYSQQHLNEHCTSDLRHQLSLPQESKLVGYIGRIAYVKALDVLAQSAELIVHMNLKVHFVLFGEALLGDKGYKRKLVTRIKKMHLINNWHWLGYDYNVSDRISDLDLLVLPSRREALGLTLVEAGLNCIPVVATNIGGIPEVVENGITGLIVAPENPEELAYAITHLINKPALSIEMGKRANIRVKRIFNPKRFCSEFLDLYGSILQENIHFICSQ